MPSNKFGAAITLDEMKLSGAPSTIFNTEDEHIAAWRTWWLKNQSKFDDASPYPGKQ